MASKKSRSGPKRTSGPTQPEAERKNVQMLLRLPPDVAEEIRIQAKFMSLTASELVARAWRAYVEP